MKKRSMIINCWKSSMRSWRTKIWSWRPKYPLLGLLLVRLNKLLWHRRVPRKPSAWLMYPIKKISLVIKYQLDISLKMMITLPSISNPKKYWMRALMRIHITWQYRNPQYQVQVTCEVAGMKQWWITQIAVESRR